MVFMLFDPLQNLLEARGRQPKHPRRCLEITGNPWLMPRVNVRNVHPAVEAGRKRELRLTTLERFARAYRIEVYQLLAPKVPATKLARKPYANTRRSGKKTKPRGQARTLTRPCLWPGIHLASHGDAGVALCARLVPRARHRGAIRR